MPCTDGGVPYPDYAQRDLNELTDIICEQLTKWDGKVRLTTRLEHWWIAHQKLDSDRLAAQERATKATIERLQRVKLQAEDELARLGIKS
jgi:hypothetical protein